MKVKDLIAKLSKCDPNAEVGVSNFDIDDSIQSVDCAMLLNKVVALDISRFSPIENTTKGSHGNWHRQDFTIL